MLAGQGRLHHSRRLPVLEDLKSTVELQEDGQGSEHGEALARERDVTIMVFSDEASATRWLIYGAD